jgi:hypothetical protein
LGISSGRFSWESVVAAIKYQVWPGRFGWLRREESSAGVIIAGSGFMVFTNEREKMENK